MELEAVHSWAAVIRNSVVGYRSCSVGCRVDDIENQIGYSVFAVVVASGKVILG